MLCRFVPYTLFLNFQTSFADWPSSLPGCCPWPLAFSIVSIPLVLVTVSNLTSGCLSAISMTRSTLWYCLSEDGVRAPLHSSTFLRIEGRYPPVRPRRYGRRHSQVGLCFQQPSIWGFSMPHHAFPTVLQSLTSPESCLSSLVIIRRTVPSFCVEFLPLLE